MKPLPRSYEENPPQGFILMVLLISTFFIMLLGVVTTQLVLSNLQLASVESYRVNAQFAADAGLDDAIRNLNQNQSYTGSAGEITLYEDTKVRVTYETAITDDSDPLVKHLAVTSRTYAPKTSATPRTTRQYAVELRGISGGNFSVVTGVGGLYMSNSAKIVGGNVYVNGEINMSNSAQIGLTSNPVTVKAAHQNCPSPADSTYPRTCNSGENGEPISISNSAKIYGEVQATNQIDGSGMSDPGLVPGTVAPSALPSHDRDALQTAVNNADAANAPDALSGAAAGCSSGTKTWPANLKINGNVSVSNSCKVTVEGDVWITGDLSVSNSAELRVLNGLTTPPVLMIDGANGFSISNNADLVSNANATPIGFRVITYYSEASCSPECSDVTGEDLYDTRDRTTITLNNGASGPQTEFYARWSRVSISNSGNIGALVGQTVQITNSGTITFGTSVSGSGGVSAWIVKSYKRVF